MLGWGRERAVILLGAGNCRRGRSLFPSCCCCKRWALFKGPVQQYQHQSSAITPRCHSHKRTLPSELLAGRLPSNEDSATTMLPVFFLCPY